MSPNQNTKMASPTENPVSSMTRPLTASELLHWSAALTSATANEDAPVSKLTPEEIEEKRKKLDPKWVDIILGKGDAVRMRECMDMVESTSTAHEDRLTALEDLESLVESIDNARDLLPLGLWPRLLSILVLNKSDEGSAGGDADEDAREVQCAVLSVIGTAVQNNPEAQKACVQNNGVSTIMAFLNSPEMKDSLVIRKGIFCISSLIRHNRAARDLVLVEHDGFSWLLDLLTSSTDEVILRKIVFLFRALIEEDSEHGDIKLATTLHGKNCLATVVNMVRRSKELDTVEKGLELIVAMHLVDYSTPEKQILKVLLQDVLRIFRNELSQDLVSKMLSILQET